MNVKSVPESAILTVAMRWSDRLFGLVSMVILARLLVPADFGIIVMTSIVIGLIYILLDLGVRVALIHNDKADRDDFDTAWTIRLIQSFLSGLVIYFSAPFAADYYNNPLVIDVLHVMVLSTIIGGFENIGIVNFQKNMEFGKDFKFFFYKRISSFVVTIIAAFILKNYWALVIGTFVGQTVGVILSYLMHPHRPCFQLSRFSSIWSFSKWILLRDIGIYLESQTHKMLVGNRTDASTLGAYSVASEISAMPTTELLAPLGRVLFPVFVQKRNDPKMFASSISTAIGVQALVALPACMGLALVAEDAVFILLGENWAMAAPLIQIIVFADLLIALAHSGGYALLAIGKVKLQALVTWLQAILFIVAVVWLFPQSGVIEIATTRVWVVAIGSAVLISIVLIQIKELSIGAYFKPMIRPLLATGIMAFILICLHPELVHMTPIIRLVIEIIVGCLAYMGSIIFMWSLSGRPEGAESYLHKNVLYKLKNMKK